MPPSFFFMADFNASLKSPRFISLLLLNYKKPSMQIRTNIEFELSQKGTAWWKRRSTECGVCLCLSVSLDLAANLKQTPFFPLYGGIRGKTRSLSLTCFFRFCSNFNSDSVFAIVAAKSKETLGR